MPGRKKIGEKNVKISGTIKPDQEKWIKEKLAKGEFYNRSHIIQEGIRLLQQLENKKD